MGQQDSLGLASGARGVLDIHYVVLVPRARIRADATVDHCLPLVGSQQHGRFKGMLAKAAGFVEDIRVADPRVPLVQEDRLHPGPLQDVRQVVGPVGGVHVDQHGAQLGRGDLQVDPLGASRSPHSNAVARPDAKAPETGGSAFDFPGKIRIRQADALVPGNERFLVRMGPDAVCEDFADRLVEQRDLRAGRIALHHQETTIVQVPHPAHPEAGFRLVRDPARSAIFVYLCMLSPRITPSIGIGGSRSSTWDSQPSSASCCCSIYSESSIRSPASTRRSSWRF